MISLIVSRWRIAAFHLPLIVAMIAVILWFNSYSLEELNAIDASRPYRLSSLVPNWVMKPALLSFFVYTIGVLLASWRANLRASPIATLSPEGRLSIISERRTFGRINRCSFSTATHDIVSTSHYLKIIDPDRNEEERDVMSLQIQRHFLAGGSKALDRFLDQSRRLGKEDGPLADAGSTADDR